MASHFEDKDPLSHVISKRAEGVVSLSESHGTEIPGHISAAADAGRETAVIFIVLWLILSHFSVAFALMMNVFFVVGIGLLFWKTGRSAWLGWSRLERLHRVIDEERWEIEHHRMQEREELKVLYRAKGFEGKLLEDVMDVLMADGDRLLRVMLEEELGLALEAYEHPLKQALGAAAGVMGVAVISVAALWIYPHLGLPIGAAAMIIAAAIISAKYEKNRLIDAAVWNVATGTISLGAVYFFLQLLK